MPMPRSLQSGKSTQNLLISTQPQARNLTACIAATHSTTEVAVPAGTMVVDVDCGGTELLLLVQCTSTHV